MPIESAQFIGDLNPANPPGTDPRSQGDDHLRLVKNVLRNTFLNLSGRFARVQVKSAAYSLHPTDNTSAIVFTSASVVTIPSASLFAGAFQVTIIARGGDLTLNTTFGQLINGATSLVVKNGEAATLFAESGAWYALVTRFPITATKAEAEAGTENTAMMTPLRTKEAIAKLVPLATFTVPGILQLATADDARSWVGTTRMLTPRSLSDAFDGSRRVPSAQGYQQFPGGLVIQWGNTVDVSSEGSYAHSFPTTFASFCLQVILGGRCTSGAANADMWPQIVSFTNSGFTWRAQSPLSTFAACGASYIAIGFD